MNEAWREAMMDNAICPACGHEYLDNEKASFREALEKIASGLKSGSIEYDVDLRASNDDNIDVACEVLFLDKGGE